MTHFFFLELFFFPSLALLTLTTHHASVSAPRTKAAEEGRLPSVEVDRERPGDQSHASIPYSEA